MSAIKEEALRCHREIEQATTELASLRKKHAELEGDLARRQHDGRDTQDVARQLFSVEKARGEKEAEITKVSQELETAMANLTAEKKLEAELHQQLNKDKDPKLDMKLGENLDKSGKKKDDLGL